MEQPEMTGIIELSYDYPARLVEQLLFGQIDVGLIPVAAMQRIPNARVVGSYGIAADGPVGSVALYSQCPIEQVEEVILDYQSRTSVELVKILLKDHWKRSVRFIESESDEYIHDISSTRAGLIIGDRALLNATRFPYAYDLAEHWKLHTGLPFVFAVWLTTTELPKNKQELFDQVNSIGLARLDLLADIWSLPGVDMQAYYKRLIKYRLDDQKRAGMTKFLSMLVSCSSP